MSDASVKKVQSKHSPADGHEKYLVSGKAVAMRLWEDEPPRDDKKPSKREYETIGYVLKGRATLEIEDQQVSLEPGDSWLVPAGATHRYVILEEFSAVEATSPPAQVHGREQ